MHMAVTIVGIRGRLGLGVAHVEVSPEYTVPMCVRGGLL